MSGSALPGQIPDARHAARIFRVGTSVKTHRAVREFATKKEVEVTRMLVMVWPFSRAQMRLTM
jgi:hypothetical protein